MSTLVGLFGHPVRQNLSAIMHNAAFAALDMPWQYALRDVDPAVLGSEVRKAVADGWVGWNVTIPHKVAIAGFMDRLSPEAALIGAVNTVQVTPEGLVGHNTDGPGFITGLRLQTGRTPEGMRVVQLGSGGAGRATAVYMAREGAAEIAIYNRNGARAAELVAALERAYPGVRGRVVAEGNLTEALAGADMVVNATPMGMWPNVDAAPPIDPAWLSPSCLVYDIVNNPPRTKLLQEASERGCQVLGGLPMLVMQGALAFELWTGRPAPVSTMREAAESAVANWR